jgi:UDP-glucuronate 4-epimerase
MRYLISGCAGFIGSNICNKLIQQGHQVLGVDRLDNILYSSGNKQERLNELNGENFTFLHGDLCSVEILNQIRQFSPEIIINEAGLPGQLLSWDSLESYTQSNLIAAYELAQLALELQVSCYVQASTSSVYGSAAIGGENLPKNPNSPYGVTKLAAENILSALFLGTNVRYVAVRYFSVYGPGQRPDMGIFKFIESWRQKLEVGIYGDGEQSRDFTYVDDAAEATLLAALKGENQTAYNISGGQVKTVNEVLKELEVILNGQILRKYIGRPRGDQLHTSAETNQAWEHLNWKSKMDFTEGIYKQVQWQVNSKRLFE